MDPHATSTARDNIGRGVSNVVHSLKPIQLDDAFDQVAYVETTGVVAKEIRSIREEVQNTKLNVERKIFEDRNVANKMWMDLQAAGESARTKDFQNTLEELIKIEEGEEDLIRSQAEAVKKLAVESAQRVKEVRKDTSIKMAESTVATERRLLQISVEHEQHKKVIEKETETKRQRCEKEIEKVRNQYKAKQEENNYGHEMEIERIKADYEAKLSEERNKQAKLTKSSSRTFFENVCKFARGMKETVFPREVSGNIVNTSESLQNSLEKAEDFSFYESSCDQRRMSSSAEGGSDYYPPNCLM